MTKGFKPFKLRHLKHPFGNVRKGHIYFIQEGTDGPIKIGFSHDVQSRLRTLQTAHTEQLRLLLSKIGTDVEERRLHHKFSQYNIRGEWFSPHQDILDYIAKRRRL